MKKNSRYMENQRSIPLHPPLARAFGVPQAIILQQIRYWMSVHEQQEANLSERTRRFYHYGRWWVYNSYENWKASHFDFWSVKTIERHILTLEKRGVLLSGNFNKWNGDKTKWYTIDFDRLDLLTAFHNHEFTIQGWTPYRQSVLITSRHFVPMVTTDCPNQIGTNCRQHHLKMSQPIPESTSYISIEIDDRYLQAWHSSLDNLRDSLPRDTFNTWLRNARLKASDGQLYTIALPPTVVANDWLESRLKPVVVRSLTRQAGQAIDVVFETG